MEATVQSQLRITREAFVTAAVLTPGIAMGVLLLIYYFGW
jgi:hypothetical protein